MRDIYAEVADPDAEDGEILEEEDKIRYDLSKLIKFPGFNVPLPENAVDVSDDTIVFYYIFQNSVY